MARKLVSYDDVAELCNSFVSAGEEPSTVKIHKQLGRGSYSTITKLIKQWKETDGKEAQAAQLPAVIELPASFTDEANLFLKKIFHLAETEHKAAIERNTLEKEQAIAQAQAEAQEAIDVSNQTSELNDELSSTIDEVKNELVEKEKIIVSITRDLEDSKKEYSQLEADYSALEDSSTKLTIITNEQKSEILQLNNKLDSTITDCDNRIIAIQDQYITERDSKEALHNKDLELKDAEIKSLSDQDLKCRVNADIAKQQHDSLIAEKDKVIELLQQQIELLKQPPTPPTPTKAAPKKRTTSKK